MNTYTYIHPYTCISIHTYTHTSIYIHTYKNRGGGSAQGRRQPRQRTDRDGKGLTGGSRQAGDEAGDEDDDEADDDDGDEDGGLVGEGLRAR